MERNSAEHDASYAPEHGTGRPGLDGRRLVVVGGSAGIGLAAAEQAAAAGADVVLVARDPARLEAAAARVRARAPVGRRAAVDVAAADAEDPAALAAALAGVQAAGAVDHVLLTAGRTAPGPVLGDVPLGTQLAPAEARVRSALGAVRALAPAMRAGGSFVFTGGLSTDRPVKGAWVSGLGTAGAEQLARVLALELAPLRFNAVSPGWTDTPMWDAMLGDQKAAVFADVAARTPVGRLVTADEVAAAALFLMANAAITGEVLHVDGGQRLT